MHCDPSHIMSGKKNGIPIYLNGIVFFNIINFHNLILKWLTLLIVLSTQLSRCPWLVAGRWFFPGTPVSPINKTDRHDITEILLKMSLNTITLTQLCRRLSYLSYKCLIRQTNQIYPHHYIPNWSINLGKRWNFIRSLVCINYFFTCLLALVPMISYVVLTSLIYIF